MSALSVLRERTRADHLRLEAQLPMLEAFAAREGHAQVCASASATFRALGGAFAEEGLVA